MPHSKQYDSAATPCLMTLYSFTGASLQLLLIAPDAFTLHQVPMIPKVHGHPVR